MDGEDHLRSGVIEGFYGRPWTERERLSLFARMRSLGLGTYLYAPKDDLKHRVAWREPYAPSELATLRALAEGARSHGIDVGYAVAPGLDLRFADEGDAAALRDKVGQALGLGIRTVALLFDDVPRGLSAPDHARFGSLAAAQADTANRLQRQLEGAGGGTLLFCPTDYCGAMARPGLSDSVYLRELGERLAPSVEVFWTGPEVVSTEIGADHLRQAAAVLRRKPLLWDNLHANDYDLRQLCLGPYAGRPPELRDEVRGILVNPNVEAGANVVPLATFASYLHDDGYRPRATFERAVRSWADELELVDGSHPGGDDLAFLADFHYLPGRQGPAAQRVLDDVGYLVATPPAAWGGTFAALAGAATRLAGLAERLALLRDRELVVALAPYLNDVLVEVGRVVQALEARRHRPEPPRGSLERAAGSGYRGGFTGALQRLLPSEAAGSSGADAGGPP